jgi:hypothetical protein
MAMPGAFKIGNHVSWNSDAGHVSGVIRRKISAPLEFKGYTVHASREEPQYLIESDKTDRLAMHKGRRSASYGAAPGRERRRGARAVGNLRDSINMAQFTSRVATLAKNQEIIFYCA